MIAVYKNNINDVPCTCDAFKRKKCRNKAIWCIFTGDGKPYLSRLTAFSCATHLSRIIKRIIDDESSTTIIRDEETFKEEDFKL